MLNSKLLVAVLASVLFFHTACTKNEAKKASGPNPMEAELSQSQKLTEDLTAQKKVLDEQVQDLETQITGLKENQTKIEARNTQLQSDVSKFSNSYEETDKKLKEANGAKEALLVELAQAEAQVKTATAKAKAASEKAAELEKSGQASQASLEESQKQLTTANQELKAASNELGQVRGELTETQSEVASLNQQVEELQNEINKYQAQRMEIENQQAALDSAQAALSKRLKEVSQTEANLKVEIVKAQVDREKIITQIASLKAQKEAQDASAQEQNENIDQRMEQLNQKAQSLKELAAALEDTRVQYAAMREKLMADQSQLQADQAQLQKDRENLAVASQFFFKTVGTGHLAAFFQHVSVDKEVGIYIYMDDKAFDYKVRRSGDVAKELDGQQFLAIRDKIKSLHLSNSDFSYVEKLSEKPNESTSESLILNEVAFPTAETVAAGQLSKEHIEAEEAKTRDESIAAANEAFQSQTALQLKTQLDQNATNYDQLAKEINEKADAKLQEEKDAFDADTQRLEQKADLAKSEKTAAANQQIGKTRKTMTKRAENALSEYVPIGKKQVRSNKTAVQRQANHDRILKEMEASIAKKTEKLKNDLASIDSELVKDALSLKSDFDKSVNKINSKREKSLAKNTTRKSKKVSDIENEVTSANEATQSEAIAAAKALYKDNVKKRWTPISELIEAAKVARAAEVERIKQANGEKWRMMDSYILVNKWPSVVRELQAIQAAYPFVTIVVRPVTELVPTMTMTLTHGIEENRLVEDTVFELSVENLEDQPYSINFKDISKMNPATAIFKGECGEITKSCIATIKKYGFFNAIDSKGYSVASRLERLMNNSSRLLVAPVQRDFKTIDEIGSKAPSIFQKSLGTTKETQTWIETTDRTGIDDGFNGEDIVTSIEFKFGLKFASGMISEFAMPAHPDYIGRKGRVGSVSNNMIFFNLPVFEDVEPLSVKGDIYAEKADNKKWSDYLMSLFEGLNETQSED